MSNTITIRTAISTILTTLLLAFALPVFAQNAEVVQALLHHRKVDPEKVKQLLLKIDEVKHERLRQVLNLDDETSKRFFAEYDPAEKDLISLVKQRNEQDLKLLQLTRGDYKDADVDPTLQSIKTLNQQIGDRYEQLDNNLKSVLAPRQRARLLIFEKEFNRRVREKIREKRDEWRENHPGKRFLRWKGGGKPPVRPNAK